VLTVLKLVGDDDLGQCSEPAVGRLGSDADSVDGVRLKPGDLGHGVRADLDRQPSLEVVVGVRAIVDDERRRRRTAQLHVRRSADRRCRQLVRYCIS